MVSLEIFLFIFHDHWHSCEILLVTQEMSLPTLWWRHLHTDAMDASSDCGSSLWLEHGDFWPITTALNQTLCQLSGAGKVLDIFIRYRQGLLKLKKSKAYLHQPTSINFARLNIRTMIKRKNLEETWKQKLLVMTIGLLWDLSDLAKSVKVTGYRLWRKI